MNDAQRISEAKRMLDLAARLALRAAGDVEPNPLVGAVIVADLGGGRSMIGMGHHRRFGGLHAEREAIDDARRRGADPRGATMYVTLEPCATAGKQPPCVEAVLAAGIARVVFAREDPHPIKGGGAEALRRAGVAVELSGASRAAIALSDPFVKRVKTGLPWVIAKWAQTIDGRIATRTGESKWISSERSRRRVHRLRARVDAIVTGLGTVLADDPMLTARGVGRIRRVAKRVVVDTDLETPAGCALVGTARQVPTILACARSVVGAPIMAEKSAALVAAGAELLPVHESARGLDLHDLLRAMANPLGASTVLLEAGSGLLGAMLEADLIDEAIVYVAPLILGDERAHAAAEGRSAPRLCEGRRFNLVGTKAIGDDVELVYRRETASS